MRIAKAFPPREVQTSPEREKRIENRSQIPSQSKVKAGKRRRNPFFLSLSADLLGVGAFLYRHTHPDITPIVAGPTVSRMPLS